PVKGKEIVFTRFKSDFPIFETILQVLSILILLNSDDGFSGVECINTFFAHLFVTDAGEGIAWVVRLLLLSLLKTSQGHPMELRLVSELEVEVEVLKAYDGEERGGPLHCGVSSYKIEEVCLVAVLDALMSAMNDELPRIQEQVYYGQINSRTDVLDKFLSESGIQRYNPQVKFGETLRRLIASVDGNALSLNIVMLKEKIRRLLSFGSNVVFTMTYADEDGDMVILATEDDLRDILPQSLNPLRITVN
ncbi:hypothetical protein Tco_1110494, partial [Tanacetum coccineum]